MQERREAVRHGEPFRHRDLGAGLRAVKVQADDGTSEYAICDEQLHPLYSPAKSLGELRQRFGHSSL